MQLTTTKLKPRLANNLDHPSPTAIRDQSSLYRPEITIERREFSIRIPMRMHQPVIHTQQDYTGDA